MDVEDVRLDALQYGLEVLFELKDADGRLADRQSDLGAEDNRPVFSRAFFAKLLEVDCFRYLADPFLEVAVVGLAPPGDVRSFRFHTLGAPGAMGEPMVVSLCFVNQRFR